MALSERRVSRPSPEAAAAMAFAKGEPGADRRVLESVADAALHGRQVSARFQKLANVLLAQALFEGKLPAKAAGRRKEELFALKNVERAYRYYELRDGGARRPAEMAVTASRSNAGERQIERAISNYRWLIGWDEQERECFRAWRASVSEEEYKAVILVELRLRDGRSVTGDASGQTLFKKASDIVKALRQELIDIMNGTYEPPPSSGEESQTGER